MPDFDDLIVNFSDPRERANFLRAAGKLEKLKRVTIKNYRKARSNQANRYLFGVVYQAFVEFRQQQGEDFTVEEAHELFAMKFLRRPVIDLQTGEVIGQTRRSTASLDTKEFSDYVEKVCAWMADYGIEVPPASRYYIEDRKVG